MLYHVSNKLYPELKSKALLNPNDKTLEEFDTRISFLLCPISENDIKQYQKLGFKRWMMDEAYLYILDPDDLEISDYFYAKMQSTPEQRQYDIRNWEKKVGRVNDDVLESAMANYFIERKTYLNNREGIPDKADIDVYLKHKQYHTWKKHEWVLQNMKTGNLEQYASDIPHLQISVNKPLKYQQVIKLY